MIPDQFSLLLKDIATLHHAYAAVIDTGFLVFARMLGFVIVAPILGRKDVPFTVKMGIALLMSGILLWTLPGGQAGFANSNNPMWYTLQIFINITVGAFIAFIASVIFETVSSAGSLMNIQIGLAAGMMFDPGTHQQVPLTEKLFSFIAVVIFFHVGGMYWIISALSRSFEIFPIYSVQPDFVRQISLDYLVQISGNTITIALQFVAPILVVTMAVDLLLGIVNRTAQQIQIYQLSFGLKPGIGFAVLLITLPIFIHMIQNFLSDYSAIF